MYKIIKVEKPISNDILEMAVVLMEAFLKNPLLGDYAFRNNRHRMFAFMKFAVKYYAKYGTCHVCKNDKDEVVAVTCWNEPDSKEMNLQNVISAGMVGKLIGLIFTCGVPTILRLLRASIILDKYHIKTKHCYLFLFGAVEKGTGRILLEDNTEYYKDYDLYLENNISKNYNKYYEQFGFKPIKKIGIGGVSNTCMIRRRISDSDTVK